MFTYTQGHPSEQYSEIRPVNDLQNMCHPCDCSNGSEMWMVQWRCSTDRIFYTNRL